MIQYLISNSFFHIASTRLFHKTQAFNMNAIIQQFQNELTREERQLFEANARLAGRRPGEHLKAVLFGPRRPRRPLPVRSWERAGMDPQDADPG